MKKLSVLKYFALLLFIFGGMTMMTSFSKNKAPQVESLTGVIEMYGNEPFSYPCIKDSEGKIYTIVADQNLTAEILKNSGYRMTFKGHFQPEIGEEIEIDGKKFVHNASKNGFFEVISFTVEK